MDLPVFKRVPDHIAIIPDGNRRWAQLRGLKKEDGYAFGIDPAVRLYELSTALGIKEVTIYGFTQDNTKRPAEQRRSFQEACVEGARRVTGMDAALLVVGDSSSPMFPEELKPLTTRHSFGKALLKINFLVNYDWHWDLSQAALSQTRQPANSRKAFAECIGSADVSRIDMVIRWGGRRRLSGMLPVQSVYADFYVIDDYWPNYTDEQFFTALRWYETQDVTLGG